MTRRTERTERVQTTNDATRDGDPSGAVTLESLRALAARHASPCVSVYATTRGNEADDRSRLEGVARRAHHLLKEKRIDGAGIERFLEPLERLASAPARNGAGEGIALFVAPGLEAEYRLPVAVPELLLVGDSFHIRPLVRYLEANQRHFVLLLGRGHAAFFAGSAAGLVPLAVPGLPRTLEEALGTEDRERSVTFHQGGRGTDPIYGGLGKSETSRDEDQSRYFRAVDAALWPLLRDETAPLVLAASEREGAHFRSITRYPHVLDEVLGSNLAHAPLPQIHERTWPILQRLVDARVGEVLVRYDGLVSRARALDDVRAIARFAVQGRVRDLLLTREANLWGKLDRETGDVALHAQRSDEAEEDVLDDLAEAVLLRGGDVWTLEAARMPTRSPVAAVLRW